MRRAKCFTVGHRPTNLGPKLERRSVIKGKTLSFKTPQTPIDQVKQDHTLNFPAFTIFTETLMHLFTPKFCITIVFNFSWVLQSSHGKSKTMVTIFFLFRTFFLFFFLFFLGGGGSGGRRRWKKVHYISGENNE